ncbi:hypothetical protein [Oceanobacillus sp. FSL K6-0251]|uniref:hypothetical protein n=1 Tax=Oceanobacillus sp. FSL K6-0251 TaxID=2921602 RepID=UPI0030F7B577
MAEKNFKDYVIDSIVELHLKLYYPRVSSEYASGPEGTYDRLEDEIKYQYIKELANNNPDWDMQEMGKEATKRIDERTSLY